MKDWKDYILNSTKGMTKAQPKSDAFDHIIQKINHQDSVHESSRSWMSIAAAISLIVLANVYFMTTYSTDSASSSQKNAESYTSLVSSYNLYEND